MDQALGRSFTPEFLGRLDKIVHFAPLDATAMEAIAQKYLNQLQKRVGVQQLQLQLPPDLAQSIARHCVAKGGARGLRRLVQEEVEGPLATFLLECGREPSRISAYIEAEHICFR